MADSFEVHDVTCPALTPSTSPLEVVTYTGGPYTVTAVWVVIPDGHAGMTGIALAYGHTPQYPSNPGAFISGNDEYFRLSTEGNPYGVAWSVFLCNNDGQDHVWETRWELELLSSQAVQASRAMIAPSDIYAAGGAAPGA